MKIQMKNNTVSLASENAAEGRRMVEFYYGVVPGKDNAPVSVKKERSYNTTRKGIHYKKACEICGKKFKRVGTHMKFKHEGVKTGKQAREFDTVASTRSKVDLLPPLESLHV